MREQSLGWLKSCCLFAGCFAILLMISSGHYGWSDDQFALEAIRNFVDTGNATITPYGNAYVGRGGQSYSKAEVGVKLLGLCGYVIGQTLDLAFRLPPVTEAFLGTFKDVLAVASMAFATAILIVVTSQVLRLLRVQPTASVLMSLAIVFGAPTLELSRYLISTNLGVLALAVSIWALLKLYRSNSDTRALYVAANAFGLGLLMLLIMRPTGVLFIPVLLIAWVSRQPRQYRLHTCVAIWLLTGLAIKGLYNYHRSGSWIQTGYAGEAQVYFERNIPIGLFVSTVVPRWGLLLNSPVSLFGLGGLLVLLRRAMGRRRSAAIILFFSTALIVPSLAVYIAYVVPQIYPTRYLAEVIYLLGLLGGWFVSRIIRSRPYMKLVAILLCGAGVLLHVGSSLVSANRFTPQFATEKAPNTWSDAFQAFAIPFEGVEGYSQFTEFPRPDWLIAYWDHNSWPWTALAVYLIGLCLIGYAASIKRKFGMTLALFFALGLMPPTAILFAASQRQQLLVVEPNGANNTPAPYKVKQVKLWKLGPRLVTEYYVQFDSSATRSAPYIDGWLALETTGTATPMRKLIRIGAANPGKSYYYGVKWQEMPGSESICVFNQGQAVSWSPLMSPLLTYNASLYLAYPKSDPVKVALGEVRFPENSDTIMPKIYTVLDPSPGVDLLSDKAVERPGFPPIIGPNFNSELGCFLPQLHSLPTWKDVRVTFRVVATEIRSPSVPELHLGPSVIKHSALVPGYQTLEFRLPKGSVRDTALIGILKVIGNATLVPVAYEVKQ